ncbi:hypothetical protein CFM91_26380 [Klebsiella pneumoniae]|nr:hypothetical protein [Klebsiella pneumoniae]
MIFRILFVFDMLFSSIKKTVLFFMSNLKVGKMQSCIFLTKVKMSSVKFKLRALKSLYLQSD